MKNNKVVFPILIILSAIIILAVIRVYFKSLSEQTACTTEAKICPDGSAVGRTGPNCEFAPCPPVKTEEVASSSNNSAGNNSTSSKITQLTYQDKEYGFELSYPGEWDFIKMGNSLVFEKTGTVLKGSGDIYAFPIIIQIEDNKNQLSPEQWIVKLEKESGLVVEQREPFVLAKNSAVKFFDTSIPGQKFISIYAAHGQLLYKLDYDFGNYSSEFLDIFNQMVAGFKFLE
jgi:hypothetical protein